MADIPAEDEAEARTEWLLRLSVDQISRYDRETMCDWLIARNEQHCARLRAACQELRSAYADRSRALERLRAAVSASADGGVQ